MELIAYEDWNYGHFALAHMEWPKAGVTKPSYASRRPSASPLALVPVSELPILSIWWKGWTQRIRTAADWFCHLSKLDELLEVN